MTIATIATIASNKMDDWSSVGAVLILVLPASIAAILSMIRVCVFALRPRAQSGSSPFGYWLFGSVVVACVTAVHIAHIPKN